MNLRLRLSSWMENNRPSAARRFPRIRNRLVHVLYDGPSGQQSRVGLSESDKHALKRYSP
jgi:hypothetical protein